MEEYQSYSPIHKGKYLPVFAVFALLYCLTLLTPTLCAQTIRLVRTDVDSGRSGFVTATQMFGVDVVLSGVKSCTGVSFELQYTNSQYIVYSNWKERQLGRMGAFAYDLSDTTSGNGSIHVGVLSGVPVPNKGIDDPICIHLDFVVRSNTPNELPVSFTFINAQAVSSTDSGGRIIPLLPDIYRTFVHSFVNIFPGDADNNGIVDSRDATTIGAYLGQGSGISNVRGYRREPASTLWLPQRALIWDSAKATYADCDGSGDITLSDNLVVSINRDKKHSIIKRPDDDIPKVKPDDDVSPVELLQEFPPFAPRQPLYISSNRNLLLAMVCALRANGSSRILGFEPSPDYPSAEVSFFRYDEESQTAYLHYGGIEGENILRNGFIGNIVFEQSGTGQTPSFTATQAYGARSSGDIFPIAISSITTGVESATTDDVILRPNPAQDYLSITSAEPAHVRIVSLLGEELLFAHIENGLTSLDISPLPSGTYLAFVQCAGYSKSYPFSVIR